MELIYVLYMEAVEVERISYQYYKNINFHKKIYRVQENQPRIILLQIQYREIILYRLKIYENLSNS